jgi:hypothetical protein
VSNTRASDRKRLLKERIEERKKAYKGLDNSGHIEALPKKGLEELGQAKRLQGFPGESEIMLF